MSCQKILAAAVVRSATVALLTLAGTTWSTSANAASTCDSGDLRGTFAFVIHGVNPVGQPFGAIGTFTADGAGNIDGLRVSVDNGEYTTAEFTCTYSMSPECLFRGPCIDDGEAIAEVQIDGALADGGEEILLVLSGVPAGPGGAVVTGVAKRQ